MHCNSDDSRELAVFSVSELHEPNNFNRQVQLDYNEKWRVNSHSDAWPSTNILNLAILGSD